MRAKQEKRIKRHSKIRAKISGTSKRPRLSVFRSNKYIYLQLIDDEKRKTLLSVSDNKVKGREKLTKTEIAEKMGRLIAKEAMAKKISEVVFDRGGYKYHGRIKAVAEGARQEGLKF